MGFRDQRMRRAGYPRALRPPSALFLLFLQRGLDLRDGHGLRGAIHDLDQTPALLLAQRARLLDAHDIADPGAIGLVMRLEARGLFVRTFVDRVTLEGLDGHDDGFLHLVAHPPPHFLLAASVMRRGRRLRLAARGRGVGGLLCAHVSLLSSNRSADLVLRSAWRRRLARSANRPMLPPGRLERHPLAAPPPSAAPPLAPHPRRASPRGSSRFVRTSTARPPP